jgi:hypothetical protein
MRNRKGNFISIKNSQIQRGSTATKIAIFISMKRGKLDKIVALHCTCLIVKVHHFCKEIIQSFRKNGKENNSF